MESYHPDPAQAVLAKGVGIFDHSTCNWGEVRTWGSNLADMSSELKGFAPRAHSFAELDGGLGNYWSN